MSNSSVAARLISSIREGRAPHAILLTGPEGCGLSDLARLACCVHCTGADDISKLSFCPDYYEFGPSAIPVDAIRAALLSLAERSFSGRRAVAFLEAHNMNAYAQNALLKTLEEPTSGTLFLLSGQEAGLLPTIRSRCSVIRFGVEDEQQTLRMLNETGIHSELAKLCVWVCDGAPEIALSVATDEHKDYFNKAADLFFMCITSGMPPYTAATSLLDSGFMADRQAKSKAAKHRPGAELCMRVFLAALREMLNFKLSINTNIDNAIALRARHEAGNFTIREIQSMIDKALSAKARLSVANPSLTLSSFFTELVGENSSI